MAGKRRDDVREEDVTGLKYFDKLAPLLARLHEIGCERDKAGNRKLHFDQYTMLLLLFLFNPMVRSLRAIEQASELDSLGLDEIFEREAVVLIEWGERFLDRMPADHIQIWLEELDADARRIEVRVRRAQSDSSLPA